MMFGLTKTPIKTLLAICFVLVFLLAFTSKANANRPVFRVTGGGDVFAGGGMDDEESSNANPCSADYHKTGDNGAIFSFAQYSGGAVNKATGSTSDAGAFALGWIDGVPNGSSGSPATYHGFASYNGSGFGKGFKNLTFANTTSGWGGTFQGTNSNHFCIDDYYFKYSSGSTGLGGLVDATGHLNSLSALADGKYQYDSNLSPKLQINSSTSITHDGRSVAIFVRGNVLITKDILYADKANITDTNQPKFALVVKGGNIYIGSGVQNLDGWYIAEQDYDSGVGGNIWTCSNGFSEPTNFAWMIANCNNTLNVNGAFTADKINLLRLGNSDVSSTSGAENFNYTPGTAIGQSYFGSSSGSTNEFSIDSVESLPPIY